MPRIVRPEKAADLRAEILELYPACKGNLVRVHEELLAGGATLSYPALTGFCRRHGIGPDHAPRQPAGQYTFAPGQEMQHDTSPHRLMLRGREQSVQTASLVLCYSHMLFFQFYPRFTRFECKLFLTEGVGYFGGACRSTMIDNTHVVVLRGSGPQMVPVPEMVAFGERYGFAFRAHAIGDANRSGRVERPFSYIEHNFLAGRDFQDLDDANRQARQWCDKVNRSFKRHLRAIPAELFAAERPSLVPLPVWVPEVYLLHQRIVDLEGNVCVHTNRYSAPADLIEKQVEVRETRDTIEIFRGPRLVATHVKEKEQLGRRCRLPAHRVPRGQGRPAPGPTADEQTLLTLVPELGDYVAALKQHATGRGTLVLRRLLQLAKDYPREPLVQAVQEAAHYGLFDLTRLEQMILRRIRNEYFRLGLPPGEGGDDDR